MLKDKRIGLQSALLLLTSTLVGCGSMAMGQGAMSTSNADDAKELNAPLAVGAAIQPDINLSLKGTAMPTLLLTSGRPDVVADEGGQLIGRAPGISAILVTTKEGVVLDFYHLWVEQASRATLHRSYADGRDMGELREGLDLMVGEATVLTPKVFYEAQELAGTLDGEWRVEPDIAAVLREGVGQRRRLVARTPGEATLTVKLANVVVTVPIRVLSAADPPVAATPPAGPPPAPPAAAISTPEKP